MTALINQFNDYMERMNDIILSKNNHVVKRLWNLDTSTYVGGALDKKLKKCLVYWPAFGCPAIIALNTTWANVLSWVKIPTKCINFCGG